MGTTGQDRTPGGSGRQAPWSKGRPRGAGNLFGEEKEKGELIGKST